MYMHISMKSEAWTNTNINDYLKSFIKSFLEDIQLINVVFLCEVLMKYSCMNQACLTGYGRQLKVVINVWMQFKILDTALACYELWMSVKLIFWHAA